MLILRCKGFSQLSLKNLQLTCHSKIAAKAILSKELRVPYYVA